MRDGLRTFCIGAIVTSLLLVIYYWAANDLEMLFGSLVTLTLSLFIDIVRRALEENETF